MWTNRQEFSADTSAGIMRAIHKAFHAFDPLNEERLHQLTKNLRRLGLDDSIFDTTHIIELWNTIAADRVSAMYDNNMRVPASEIKALTPFNLLQISRKYTASPLSIIRRFLTECYDCPKKHVKSLLADPEGDKFIIDLLEVAYNHDWETPKTAALISIRAKRFEETIGKMLMQSDIKFASEERLLEMQRGTDGKILTPDFVLLDPIMLIVDHNDGRITRHTVRWIDAKNYAFLKSTDPCNRRLQVQAKKYVDAFGPGAFIFHYGFNRELTIPGVVMLSYP